MIFQSVAAQLFFHFFLQSSFRIVAARVSGQIGAHFLNASRHPDRFEVLHGGTEADRGTMSAIFYFHLLA